MTRTVEQPCIAWAHAPSPGCDGRCMMRATRLATRKTDTCGSDVRAAPSGRVRSAVVGFMRWAWHMAAWGLGPTVLDVLVPVRLSIRCLLIAGTLQSSIYSLHDRVLLYQMDTSRHVIATYLALIRSDTADTPTLSPLQDSGIHSSAFLVGDGSGRSTTISSYI